MFQKIAIAGAAAGLLVGAIPAQAWEPDTAFVPAVQLHWTFGGPKKAKPDLSLRLNYAADPRALRLPSIAEWTVSANGDEVLRLNGVPLTSRNLFASETGGAQPDPASSGAKVALIILGAGGATALAIGALGNAAEENNPAVSNNQSSVACMDTPVGSNCVVGNGG